MKSKRENRKKEECKSKRKIQKEKIGKHERRSIDKVSASSSIFSF
jgi:hypothetical protein